MIQIDKKRLKEIFRLIFNAYANKTGIFATLRAENLGPQNVFRPQGVTIGDKDHLYWLTLVALSDKRTNSPILYRNFARMFHRNKSLFKRGVYPSLARMTNLFRAYKIALPVMEIAFFLQRKRHLDELFGGDPLKIYEGVSDIDELMKKLMAIAKKRGIRNLFPGAKRKIFSLLAMFLSEFTELEFADIVPIDVWVQSICTSSGVLIGSGQIDINVLEKMLRPLMTELFQEFRSIKGAPNATWIQGKMLCTNCARLDMSIACPIYHLCKGPFSRMRHPVSDKHYGRIQMPPQFIPKALCSS